MQSLNSYCDHAGAVHELSTAVHQCWASHTLYERPVSSEFKSRHALNGRSILTSQRYQLIHNGQHEIRIVSIRGGNADILNVLLFPAQPEWQPLLVIDVFSQRGTIRALFVDLPYVGSHTHVREQIADELQRWSIDPIKRCPAPEWATRFSTGHYVFGRDLSSSTASIAALMERAVQSWNSLSSHTPHVDATGQHQRLERFKKDHLREAPNEKFLAAAFGREWTTRYLSEFLYQ